MSNIRLVNYGTPAYGARQRLLGLSARAVGAVDETSAWNPRRLLQHGFAERCPYIPLHERGGGWWTWKPYVILAELKSMNDDDWLVYCDVGRSYPIKLLDRPLTPLLDWCAKHGQSALPGVHIPWFGPMRVWTKRDAFVLTGTDEERYHEAIPIQASFSCWRACKESRLFVEEWLDLCSDRRLVTDDPNTCGKENLSGFREHRHDQSLLTLLCMQRGLRGLALSEARPTYDEKNPTEVARVMGEPPVRSMALFAVRSAARTYTFAERVPRLWTGWRYRRALAKGARPQ